MRVPFFSAAVRLCLVFVCSWVVSATAASQLLEHVESESGSLLPGYTTLVSAPFVGVGSYANNDGVQHSTAKFANAPGVFSLSIRGASTNSSAAGMSVFLGTKKLGSVSFTGTTPSIQKMEFTVTATLGTSNIRFVLESDTGANDTLLDWYELHYVGEIPPPPAAPKLPVKGAYYTGQYRNLFVEAGYSADEVNKKLNAAYDQLFHSPNKGVDGGEALFIEDAKDPSMAYIWDVHNDDVRSEGMSYGMMMAVQMNRQVDFNKLWKWAKTYSQNKSGNMKGYFAWKVSRSGQVLDKNPAADGEEYFVTALFFAAHRWGNGTGIFNYEAEANALLDAMYDNGESHYNHLNQLVNYSLFDHTAKQVLFTPDGSTASYHTDPSYHLPAFYELWALWAARNNDFWKSLAVESRRFWKTTIHPTTGLNPDYAAFDGKPESSAVKDRQVFTYDAWRTIANSSLDYSWWKADEWQVTYAKRLQSFFKNEESINDGTYFSLYELDGRAYSQERYQSTGLVAMNAVGSLASDSADAWRFVDSFWNKPIPTGRHRYYDGSLYMLGLLAATGNFRVYCPKNTCAAVSASSQPASSSSLAASSRSVASSVPLSSQPRSSTPASSSVALSSSSRSSVAPSSVAISSSSTALSSSSGVVIGSGLLEAERFTNQSGIQTETTTDTGGGLNIGYIENGDYVDYAINVPKAGNYKITLRVASATNGGAINFSVSNLQLGSANVSSTGAWQSWTNISTQLHLSAGNQTLRLSFSGASGYLLNLNWMQFAEVPTSSTATTSSVASSIAPSSSSRSSSSSVASSVSSSSKASSSSANSSAANGLVCQHVVESQWDRSFNFSIRITNTTSAPITNWSATWSYAQGFSLSHKWNANFVGVNPYTATALPWMTTINPGQTINLGGEVAKLVFGTPAPTNVAVNCRY
jgi:oligosaccharide reducing-end xylanase